MMAAFVYVDCGFFGDTQLTIHDAGDFGDELDSYIDCGDFNEFFMSQDDFCNVFQIPSIKKQIEEANLDVDNLANDFIAFRGKTQTDIDNLDQRTKILTYVDCGKFGEIQNTIHDAGDFGDSPDYLDCGNFDTVSYISRDDVSNLNSFGHLETEVTNLKNKVTSELNRTDSYINSSYRLIAGTRTDIDELQNIVSVFAYTDCGKFGETRNTILDGGEFGDRQLSNLDCGDFNGYYVSREDLKAVTQILNMQDKLSNLISLVQDYEKRLTKLEQGIDCGNFTAV